MTQSWIRRRLINNLGWKLASLGLSAVLWYAVEGEPELVTIQSVPLLYRNLPTRLMLLSDAPQDVHAELRGASGKMTRATLEDVFASIDLSGVVSPGAQTFTLSGSDFSLPQGVAFLRAVPSQVSLRFDRSLTKSVPVTIQVTGNLPPGYRLAGKSVEPSWLNVSGPEQRMSGIVLAQTDPVSLNGITQNTDIKVNAFVSESHVQFESPPVVKVHLTIEKTEDAQ